MVGTLIGTYRLDALLGDGGLGGVYRAVDGASGREAAFRVFAREVSSDAMLADRLRAMAPALKKLQHPNIAAFFELVNVGDDLALFLEYVPGAPLDKVRDPTGRLDVSVSVSCAVQVLRALESSHGAGVLHHALRPSNVMVTRQGTVKVLDFGIGHAFGANRKTREDRLLTVLAYLAPEQIQNQPGDARSDIYSVGVLLYELLTGKLPFDHKTEFALRQAHLAEPPAAPRTLAPGLPEWLDQAVLRALAKNPASRYQNATEFRAVLEAALGLSTSREAAIVRQRDGATVETFNAAPPIPEPPSPLPVGAPGRSASGARPPAALAAAPTAAKAATAAETVMAKPLARDRPTDAESTTAPAPARRGVAAPLAAVLVVLGLAGGGAYLWLREPLATADGTPAAGQAEAAAGSATAVTETMPPAAVPPAAEVPAAAPARPPAPAGAGAPPAAGAAPSPARKPQAKLPEAPSATPPPAAANSAGAVTARVPDVSYRKVKLITQAGSSEKSTDVVLLLSDDRLSVTPAGGGAALRTVRYAEITGASYSKAQKRRLGFIRSAQHLLEVGTAGEPLLLRLDTDNVEAILDAIQSRSGQAVSR